MNTELKSTKERISDAVHQASMANELLASKIGQYETSGLTLDGVEMQVLVEALTSLTQKNLNLLIDLTEGEAQS